MTKHNITTDEMRELLRYFIGTPPYLQDNRFRELVNKFEGTDERPAYVDDRMSTHGQDLDNQPTFARDETLTDGEQTTDIKQRHVVDPKAVKQK